MILPINSSLIQNKKASKTSFGNIEKAKEIYKNPVLSAQTHKLFKILQEVIDEKWVKLKKSKSFCPGEYPFLSTKKPINGADVSLKMLYNNQDRYLIEVNRYTSFEKISINRRRPDEFIYEKGIFTPSGSATSKAYDSSKENNEMLNKRVNSLLEEYLPELAGIKEPKSKIGKYEVKVNI